MKSWAKARWMDMGTVNKIFARWNLANYVHCSSLSDFMQVNSGGKGKWNMDQIFAISKFVFNSSTPRIEQTSSFLAVFLKSGVNVANYLKKCCSCGQPKQNFFKYFSTQPSNFEKMSITNDVWLLLGQMHKRNTMVQLTGLGSKCPRLNSLRLISSIDQIGCKSSYLVFKYSDTIVAMVWMVD